MLVIQNKGSELKEGGYAYIIKPSQLLQGFIICKMD